MRKIRISHSDKLKIPEQGLTPAPGILPNEVKTMDAKGFIKISRQVLSLDIWKDPYDC